MKTNIFRLAAILLFCAVSQSVSQPVSAGQVKQIAGTVGCIQSITPGIPLLSGIPTGKLSPFALVKRCGGLSLSIAFHKGLLRSSAVQNRFIPKYITRGKGLAIPDARLTISNQHIREAWLTRPNQRYDHAILGDNIEAGGLAVITANKRRLEILLPDNSVFEDRMARMVDLDGDGKNEIVVVRTYIDRGAAIAIYAVDNQEIVELAQSKAIGLSHRWLNPVAAADFDGDGKVELAWVETPHIGGTLIIARLIGSGSKRQLKIIAKLRGFSNHTIGSRLLLQGVTFDWNGDGVNDIILPGARRQTIKVVSLVSGTLKVIDEMKIDGQIASPLIATDLDGDGRGEVLLVTKDARLFSFSP